MTDVRTLPMSRIGRLRNWEWQSVAACRGSDTATFYHPENERGPSRVRRELRAKQFCAACPVVEECLRWALETREPYGVWGGMSVEEREHVIRKMSA